jgi:hypothetical protein
LPDEDNVFVQLDQEREFRVQVDNDDILTVQFFRGDSILTFETNYLYRGQILGRDSLSAKVELSGGTYGKQWQIEVEAGSAPLPPAVPGLSFRHGIGPGDIEVSWTLPPPSATPRPLLRYLVKLSHSGPLSEANWATASLLESVPHVPGQGGYLRVYDDLDYPVIQPGEEAWLAVRVEDVSGMLSPLGTVRRLRITEPYWLEGFLHDDTGVPLNDVIVDYGCDTCKTTTELDGSFILGPFRDVDKFLLTTRSSNQYYDFQTDSVSVETPQPLQIILINRWGIDPDCASSEYDGEFLSFLRKMTRTDDGAGNPDRVLLWKWDNYPINVFIFDAMNDAGTFSFGPLTRIALAAWNEKLGETYFLEVSQQAEADMLIQFTNVDMGGFLGLTEITEPSGNWRINEVIPQKMMISLRKNLNDENLVVEVLLHELGHSLCMGAHSNCNDDSTPIHIMSIPFVRIMEQHGGSAVEAISEDEKNAVRCIRNLPQGTPMNRFFVEEFFKQH